MCGVGNCVGHSGGVTCNMLLFYHHLWTRCVSKGPKTFFFFFLFLQFRRILPTPSAFNCRWLPFRQSQGKFPWAEEKCLKFLVERQLFFRNFAPPGVYFLIKRDASQASHSHLQDKSNMLVGFFFFVFFEFFIFYFDTVFMFMFIIKSTHTYIPKIRKGHLAAVAVRLCLP